VLKIIRIPDRDPSGFRDSELDPDRTFEKTQADQIWISKLHFNQRGFPNINRIGLNIWTGLPDYSMKYLDWIRIAKFSDLFNTIFAFTVIDRNIIFHNSYHVSNF